MKFSQTSTCLLNLILAGVASLFLTGCVTIPPSTYKNMVVYPPSPSPVRYEATGAVQVQWEISPENIAIWKRFMNSDANIENYKIAVIETIQNDILYCGLFTRVVPAGSPGIDYLIKIRGEELRPSDYRLQMNMALFEASSQKEVSNNTRFVTVGTNFKDWNMKVALAQMMHDLKADMVGDLQKLFRQRQQEATNAIASTLHKASLADLLVSSDKTEYIARERNRALIAAKTQQLPAILRDKKTDELTALVVKIEQTMLDLNHECEVAKDRAQQAIAAGELSQAPGGAVPVRDKENMDELRGLTICYRERIELLKPIAGAIKEEIANRNR